MKKSKASVEEFNGVAGNIHRARLGNGLFQVDSGGERFEQGTWKVRRGMRHTSLAKVDSAVVTLIGFQVPGGDFSLLSVEGTNAHGDLNVTQQTDPTDEGFGAGGFGEGGFGESFGS